jgi:hypothetical protein
VSSTPPTAPVLGDVWIDSNTGIQYFYIDDGDSLQWIEFSNFGTSGLQGDVGFTGSQGDSGFTGSQGDTGFTGSSGAGFIGSQGDTGFTGFTGSQGAGLSASQIYGLTTVTGF